MKINKVLAGTIALILVAGLGTPAFAGGPQVTLADLLAGQSIVFGDKEFKNFRNFVSNSNGANASPIDPAGINVNPISVSGEIGLEFSEVFVGPSAQMRVGGESSQDTTFDFDVVVLVPTLAIDDNTLELGFHNLAGAGTIGISTAKIEERVFDTLQQELAFKEVFVDTTANIQLSDHKTFPPQSQITVNVNIALSVASSAGQSIINDIMITFSQTQISDNGPVGGEFLPIDSTALMLAGLQSSAIWMLPVLAGIAGSAFGILYIKYRRN